MHDPPILLRRIVLCALALITTGLCACSPPEVARIPVQFTGGHDTDPVDQGRPVVLIAAALGVEPEIEQGRQPIAVEAGWRRVNKLAEQHATKPE